MAGNYVADPVVLRVGEMTRAELLTALEGAGVQLNEHATTLLQDAVFDDSAAETFEIVQHTVGELGLTEGAVLSQILEVAAGEGLLACPAITSPYLRLGPKDQAPSTGSMMSTGRAPTGSITVASEPLREDDAYPKGFYLRATEGQLWLRGYRCGDDHLWSSTDRFAFRKSALSG